VEGKGLSLEKRQMLWLRKRVNSGKKDAVHVEGKGLTLIKIKMLWKGKG
jgi:hypothetical protein